METAIYNKQGEQIDAVETPDEFSSIGSVPYRKVESALLQIAGNEDINVDDLQVSFEYLVGSFFPDIMDNIHKEMTLQFIEGYKAGKEANK